MTFEHVALLHLITTAFLCGLIWFVQIVHYPLFASVSAESFVRYEGLHTSRTTWVVLPPMVVELGLSIWLLFRTPTDQTWIAAVGAGLVGAIWLSTFLVQVPCHQRLSAGFEAAAWRRLVRSNWLRTAAWSVRAVLAAYLTLQAH